MLTKIFNFIIVYILSIVNFFVILMPITCLIILGYAFGNNDVNKYIYYIMYLFVSFISFLMIVFLLFDLLFNRTVGFFLKTCQKIDEEHELFDIFDQVKRIFNINNVELVIQNSNEINAYAVGGFRKNVIVLTKGLIDHYKEKTSTDKEYLISMQTIISHEMSHIINKDFLPGLLIMVNERASKFVSKIVLLVFKIFINLMKIIPFIGFKLSDALTMFYNALNSVLTFVYSKIFLKLYYFVKLQISRNIEYRADKQAAYVVGGQNASYALSLLGRSGFFSLFSTHPRTASRVKAVRRVKPKSRIKSVPFVDATVYLSLIFIIGGCIYSTQLANIPALVELYKTCQKQYHNIVHNYEGVLTTIKFKLQMILNK